MKRFTHIVCIILVVVTVLSVPAQALGIENQRGSDYFMKYSVFLEEISGSKFEVWFDVTAVQSMNVLGVSEIKVQRSTDQVNWTTVKTYDKDDYSQMTDTSTIRHSGCVTYSYTSGYYYSAVIELYAKKGSSYAEMTVVTPIEYF